MASALRCGSSAADENLRSDRMTIRRESLSGGSRCELPTPDKSFMTDHHKHAELAGLEDLIGEPEGERLEFKEARGGFHFERLAKYCAALSNEGGGSIVLGVTDRRPRRIVGTGAFEEPGRTVAGLTDRLPIDRECREVQHPDGRVLIFPAP